MNVHGGVLVIVAHADDETLGCGATLARLAATGNHAIRAMYLADGETSRQPLDGGIVEIGERKRQFAAACRALGIRAIDDPQQPFPDQRLDAVPLLDVTRRIEAAVTRFRPGTVFTHASNDLNLDHRVVHDAVLTACRPTPGQTVKEIYGIEIASSTEWGKGFAPGLFVDVYGYLDAKLSAMACYAKEQPAFPHPRSREALVAHATWRGATCGVGAAEAFEIVRMIR